MGAWKNVVASECQSSDVVLKNLYWCAGRDLNPEPVD